MPLISPHGPPLLSVVSAPLPVFRFLRRAAVAVVPAAVALVSVVLAMLVPGPAGLVMSLPVPVPGTGP